MTWGIFSAQEFFYLLRIILAAACGGAIGFVMWFSDLRKPASK